MSWTIPSISGTSQPRRYRPTTIILHYERGGRGAALPRCTLTGSPDPKLGAFLRYEAKPNEPENLREVLRQEQKGREQLQPGDFKAHVTALHDSLIRTKPSALLPE